MKSNAGLKTALLVFCVALATLSYNLWLVDIASGWIDHLILYGAQDEAAYTRQAIHMITTGEWMSPTMLGRFVLEKPPMLMWLSAISMKLFGISSLTARLPAVLSGALIVTICFNIARINRSIIAGIAAALLCLSNQVLFTMARHNMTDILLALWTVIAFKILVQDPTLDRRTSRLVFTLVIAAGILTKSVAGLLPALAALLFALVAAKPLLWRAALLTGLAILLASPWFLCQLIEHRDWFLADNGFQLVKIGLRPDQTASNPFSFYLIRLIYAAPLTLALGITGLPGLIAALRRRETVVVLLTCFLVVFSAALLIFRFRSKTYLTPLFPVAILLAALTSPLLNRWSGYAAAVVMMIVFFVKAASPEREWGISYEPGSTVAASDVLSGYCEEHRGNDLYVLDIEDQLYAVALPLAHVRYGWIDPDGSIRRIRPHLEYLGIMQAVSQPADKDVYAARLRAWGMQSTGALRTGIGAATPDDLAGLVLSHPESDFLISPRIAARLSGRESQTTVLRNANVVLLQSKVAQPGSAPQWTCNL